MTTTAQFEVKDKDYLGAFENLGRALLELDEVDALLAPRRQQEGNWVMPALISDPAAVVGLDPLSPIFPLNGARNVTRLSRTAPGGRVAVFMRPCEVRAFVELVKLKQGDPEPLFSRWTASGRWTTARPVLPAVRMDGPTRPRSLKKR
jgi:formate dehydrogenase subunit beta